MDAKIVKAIGTVTEIRNRLDRIGLKIITIGQCQGYIHIFVEDMDYAEKIKPYLLEDELKITYFHRV